MFRRILLFLVLGSLAFAVLRLAPGDGPAAVMEQLRSLAGSFETFVNGVVDATQIENLPEQVEEPLPLLTDPSPAPAEQ